MNLENGEIWNAMKDSKYRRTMQSLAKVISGTHGNFDAALAVALNEVVEAVHAEAGTLWFYDRNGDGLIRPRAQYAGADMKDIFLLPGEGIAGKVIRESKPEIISNCRDDKNWTSKSDLKTGFETESMICTPLIANGYTFGCIQIINKTDNIPFDESDLNFVIKLSDTASNCFMAQKLLEGYLEPENATKEISFEDILFSKNIEDVEKTLRTMEFFARLNSKDQNRVIENVNEIWKIVNKKNR